MANHKSAKSRIVRNNKRAVINGARRSRVRTFVKKVEAAIAAIKSWLKHLLRQPNLSLCVR